MSRSLGVWMMEAVSVLFLLVLQTGTVQTYTDLGSFCLKDQMRRGVPFQDIHEVYI